ncbi:hypothetical protein Bbelb_335960, partial [Branchiostoma belcheri]
MTSSDSSRNFPEIADCLLAGYRKKALNRYKYKHRAEDLIPERILVLQKLVSNGEGVGWREQNYKIHQSTRRSHATSTEYQTTRSDPAYAPAMR